MPSSYAASRAWTLLDPPQRIHLLRVIAVLVGIVIPLLVIGRGAAAILVPVIGGLVAAALHWPRSLEPLRAALHRPIPAALAAMLALWLASVPGSLKPGFSFFIWLQVAGLLLFVACVRAVLAETPRLHRWTLRILLVMGVAGPAIAAISLELWPGILALVRPVTFSTSLTPVSYLKSYAAVMPCLAPVLIWASIRLGGAWRVAAAVGILIGIVVVHSTNDRSAMAGYAGCVFAVGLALAFRRASRAARTAGVIALAIAAVAVAWYVISHLPPMPFPGPQVERIPTWLVDAHRQAIWGFVFDKALERPWLGWGPSMANFMPGANDPVPGIGQQFVPLHAHNWPIQLFNDVGVIGLVAAVVALGVFVFSLERRFRAGDGAALAALGLCAAFFISNLANFSIWQGWWQSVLAVLLPVVLAGSRSDPRAEAGRTADPPPFRPTGP